MRLGVVGLGGTGANILWRLAQAGHDSRLAGRTGDDAPAAMRSQVGVRAEHVGGES